MVKIGGELVLADDYYKILDVDKNSSENTIKKNYRRLAMKYHPDKTKGDINLENKFKKISEAYAVLSDPDKRKQYDTFGSENFHRKYSQEDIFKNFDFGNIFDTIGEGNFFSFSGFNNSGFNLNSGSIKGSNLVHKIPLSLHEVFNGTRKIIELKRNNKVENISVKIPPGMVSGKKLRLPKKGNVNRFGRNPGDLFIESELLPNKDFVVKKYDLFLNKHIKLTQSILGTSIRVDTLDGGKLTLRIPPGTKHKTKMRLIGRGFPYMKKSLRGDLYVLINVIVPKKMSEEQKKIVLKLSDTGL